MNCSRALGRALSHLGLMVATCLVQPQSACADEQLIPIAVEYRPGKACAPEEQFTRQLQARLPRVRRVGLNEAKHLFRIHFIGSEDGLIGHFEMQGSDGTLTRRTIPRAGCSELVTAMALIAAVLIDPNTGVSSSAPTLPVTAPLQPQRNGSQPGGDVSRVGYQAGVGGVLEGAIVPKLAAGLSIEVGFSLETRGLFRPSLSAALLRTFPAHVDSPRGTARFEWTAFRLMASPLRWPVRGPVALRPGVLLDFGKLEASGEQTENASSTAITWSALGMLLRLEMTAVQRLSLVLDGGVVVPLRHDRFYFAPNDPNASVFTIPRIDMTTRLGVATHF